jgi:peptidoglycan L-alanyl-D-glutamate endopeptidase CwlK
VTFSFGERSRKELVGVQPKLVASVEFAIGISPIDFAVHDGLRTLEEQREYLRTGASKTLNSKHLKQADGYGHAVDLVPYVNGKLRWELPLCIQIAGVVWQAATADRLELVWGGVWDRQLDELDPMNLEAEIEAYRARRRKKGRDAFIDGPHFELFW